MNDVISKFDGEFDFLSNFYPSPIVHDGAVYPTAEHLYQAMKTEDLDERETIRLMITPGRAKRAGKHVTLRNNWETLKVHYMKMVLFEKFKSNRHLIQRLIDTEDAALIEGNTWGDTFWGVCDGRGKNVLGNLLMDLREEFKSVKGSLNG